ncbi:M81 family peptidase [bacterium]|nr:M81 family peptidase [bacterium]
MFEKFYRFRSNSFCSGLVLMIMVSSCSPSGDQMAFTDQKTILFAEFMHEVNSFSPIITTEINFKADHLFYGDDVIASATEEDKQLAGFLEAVEKTGSGRIKAIPIIQAKSMSGGPVDSLFYKKIKSLIIDAVMKQESVDGIYLSLHGAMGVQGMFDPEGDLIKSIRDLTGPETVIAVTFDLHANITERRAGNADIIVGYHTNPHRDHFRTAFKAGDLLIRTVLGEIEPVMVVNKMKLLKGGGINIDFLPPFRKIFAAMKKMEKQEEVLSVSFFPVHIWIDEPELGYSTVGITNGDPDLSARLADEISEMAWAVRDVPQPEGNTPEEAVALAREKKIARALGTLVLCDVSDAVGTGTPGESTWILKALVEQGSELTSYIALRDGEAARQAWEHNTGDEITLTVGGKIDTVYNKPFTYTGLVTMKQETTYGKTVIIRHNGIHLILSELPMASRTPADFKDLGLSIWKADIVVVKNLFPFRYNFLLYNRKTVNVISPGLSNTDPFALNYVNITRPIYPLDPIESWR